MVGNLEGIGRLAISQIGGSRAEFDDGSDSRVMLQGRELHAVPGRVGSCWRQRTVPFAAVAMAKERASQIGASVARPRPRWLRGDRLGQRG